MTRDTCERCLETTQGAALAESNPRPTHYERVTMPCYRRRDANDVAVRIVPLLAVVGCSGSFKGHRGGTTWLPVPYGLCRLFRRRVGGLGGFRAGPEGINLDHQPSADRSSRFFLSLEVRVLAAQLGELLGGATPALAPHLA